VVSKIPLGNKKGLEVFALVDDEDFEHLSQWKWSTRGAKNTHIIYAQRSSSVSSSDKRRTIITMHRQLLNPGPRVYVDHIDGNGVNNQKLNLRVCTSQTNQFNSDSTTGTSKYKGVCFDTRRGKWRAYLMFNRKHVYLGRFDTEWEAAEAYNEKAFELFGDFARLNRTSYG